MAIFTSTLVTSSKKKVGNLVTSKLRGQNILKSYNPSPTNPNTVNQQNTRAKMANAVKFWQFFAGFFNHFLYQKSAVESVYNSFIRLCKESFSTIIASTKEEVFKSLIPGPTMGTGGKLANIDVDANQANITITFDNQGYDYEAGYIVQMLIYNETAATFVERSHAISNAEWTAQTATFAGGDADATMCLYYAYNAASKVNSGIEMTDY